MWAKNVQSKSDIIGIASSALCFIHCVATPFLFIAKSCSVTCCSSTPGWWKTIDLVFLAISLLAVIWSVRKSSAVWIRFSLVFCWTVLLFIILNEYNFWMYLPKSAIFFPAIRLIILHIVNIRNCKCHNEKCPAS